MKKNKILSFLLALAMVLSIAAPGSMAVTAHAADGDPENPNKGMVLSKTAVGKKDGSYTITLEAYATGEKITSTVEKDIPTDIVLVLDQSGSMKEDMNTYGFRPYTNKNNSNYYYLRHNGAENPNLYYKLEDESYATVSVERDQGETYTECPSSWPNGAVSGDDNYYSNRNNLYVKVGEKYQKVTLSTSGDFWNYTYTYTFPDSTSFKSQGYGTSPGNFDGKGPLYVRSTTREYSYTYSYTDKDGTSHQIGTSDGAGTHPTDFTLYQRYSTGSVTRLQALKNAVTTFSNSVATKAAGKDGQLGNDDDVDHRIAVVGFAYGTEGYSDGYYNDPAYTNTELFIGSNQYGYGNAARDQYANAFQSMKTTEGQANVTASIGALTANGATYVDCGMEIANGVLNANPVPAGEKRNRIVIVFTDGAPGWSGYESDVANSAITQANTARTNGANVYSVGIFDGADATSAGNQNGDDTQKSNWFMQNLSDNKGTPQNPSYYLSASDADTLNNIFEQISDNIQEGGSAIDLGSEAVIKDIISPQFTLPEGATANNITLETYNYTGKNEWSRNSTALGATATVNGDQVNVTGFDFKENWCGTDTTNGNIVYRGNKLVISFNVQVKEGFLGGNGVYTNTNAGVYENADAKKPVFTFERPQVDVEIGKVTVTPEDKNVYLLGDLTEDQIKSGATAKVGDVELKLGKENYGLQPWQNEYVNITVTYKDKDDNTITKLDNLTEDTTYTVSVTVAPKTVSTATAETGSNIGKINVFKPVLTYKDSDVYYGADAPTDFSENLVSPTVWKHDETLDSSVTMTGTAPDLTMSYTPEAGAIVDGKINTKQDIPVDVTVMINDTDVTEDVSFLHRNCAGQTCDLPKGKEFLLHVKTATLTITKQGSDGKDPGQGYIFDVTGPNNLHFTVSVEGNGSVTISGLPFGEYTVTEQQDWSWRYVADGVKTATIDENNLNPSVTVTNTRTNPYLLDGNAYARNNAVKSGSAN